MRDLLKDLFPNRGFSELGLDHFIFVDSDFLEAQESFEAHRHRHLKPRRHVPGGPVSKRATATGD